MAWHLPGAARGACPNRGREVPGTSGPCEDRCVTEDNGRQIVAEQLYATLKTNHGDINVRLLPNHAPKTVKNFVELATGEREWTNPETGQKTTDKLYDGTVFHRVISGFMIQGGDPLGNGTGGPGYQFADEFHPDLAFDKPYLLAMANAGPGTNGSQFFITVSPTAWLTGKHTIFGEVADPAGQKVVDEIAAIQTNPRTDRPVKDVVIESVVVETREG
ncbi:Peptidyl-prolyl cis-trans isomerase B [Streptomyces sp. ADI98-12]|nr:Peptidyl-prolyl cis-trans isomerase B [Streptomyces sp. ADI98-12]